MKAIIAIVHALVLVVSCSDTVPPLLDEERELVVSLGFDEELIAKAKGTENSLERLWGVTAQYDWYEADGIVVITRPNWGRSELRRIRGLLEGSEYGAFVLEAAFGFEPDRVAIIRSQDPYRYLNIVRPDGINYDILHDQVLQKYKEWDKKYGLALIGASNEWLEATFEKPPANWIAFANEVYELCPDVVDQGTGSVQALAAEMARSNELYLWWD